MTPSIAPDRTKAPEVRPFGPLVLPEGMIHDSGRGVPVHVFDCGTEPLCRVSFVWRGGEYDAAFCGRTALAMQEIREGTADMSPHDMADFLDFNSARLVTVAGRHSSTLRLTCSNSRLDRVLPVVAQCILRPAMPQKTVEVNCENAAVAAAIALRRVDEQASYAAVAQIFGKSHPAARIATPELCRSLSREDLLATQAAVCNTVNGLEVFVAGRVDEKVFSTVCDAVNMLASEATGLGTAPGFYPMCPEPAGETTVFVDDALQSGVCINIPSIPRDNPDYQALRTTVMALGGYFGSRLMSSIREDKGYTYGINAVLSAGREGAYISINSQQDVAYTRAVIDATFVEIDRLRTELMPDDELARLRSHAMSEIATVLDTPFSISEYRMSELTEGMPHDYYSRLQQIVREITPDVIREMARRYIDPAEARIAIATRPA